MKKLASLATIQQAPEAKPEPTKPVRDKDALVLFNIKLTPEQRKALRQIALNMDITAKDVLMIALDEFKQKRGIR